MHYPSQFLHPTSVPLNSSLTSSSLLGKVTTFCIMAQARSLGILPLHLSSLNFCIHSSRTWLSYHFTLSAASSLRQTSTLSFSDTASASLRHLTPAILPHQGNLYIISHTPQGGQTDSALTCELDPHLLPLFPYSWSPYPSALVMSIPLHPSFCILWSLCLECSFPHSCTS